MSQKHLTARRQELEKAFQEYMHILGEQSQVEELARIYTKMTERSIIPPLYVYNQLLADFGKLEQVALVEQVYTDMLQRGVKPSQKTYDIMINVCLLLVALPVPFFPPY